MVLASSRALGRRGRRPVRQACVGVALLVVSLVSGQAVAEPMVRWVSEPVAPGDVVLLYGDDLANLREVRIARLPDGDPGTPLAGPVRPEASWLRVPSIQPSRESLKFVLPASLAAGVLALDV